GLERSVFDEEAAAVKAALTDEAIDKAVALLPAEWHKMDGTRLPADLKDRRHALPATAATVSQHISARLAAYLTSLSERAVARRSPNGDLELTVAPTGADGKPGEPSFHRVCHKDETDEVRLYALGGDDTFVVTGGKGPIRIRALGGEGNDVLDDSQGGG